MTIDEQLLAAARKMSDELGRLRFAPPVAHVYNPLDYAWERHREYIRRFGNSRKRIVFLGMNPGPFGMVQTGVPFGEVAAVRDWMKISGWVGQPAKGHPKRPVQGFACQRSEVSGRRLWGLFAKRFGSPEAFFAEHFVANYCPLAFLEAGGRNRTPDKLPPAERGRLHRICDAHLKSVIEVLQPEWVIGVGGFALRQLELATAGSKIRAGQILHPSPASPAANRGWEAHAGKQMRALGLWE